MENATGEGTFLHILINAFSRKDLLQVNSKDWESVLLLMDRVFHAKVKTDTQAEDFWEKIPGIFQLLQKNGYTSQYRSNSKKGKKIMDQLKKDFDIKVQVISKTYNV